jgi:hypothetical protein
MASESGPWSIWRFEFDEGSDVPNQYFTISWSFDSQAEAANALSRVAQENSLSEDELVIIYTVFPRDLG